MDIYEPGEHRLRECFRYIWHSHQGAETYDSGYICNHSDHEGRYAFNSQPGIGFWNVTRLASAVSSLIADEVGGEKAEVEKVILDAISDYAPTLEHEFTRLMRLVRGNIILCAE